MAQAQLQLETSGPAADNDRIGEPSSLGHAGPEDLHPEGTDVGAPPRSCERPPRQAASSLAAPGELCFPTSKAVAEQFARTWARRGVKCEVVPNGRKWVVQG